MADHFSWNGPLAQLLIRWLFQRVFNKWSVCAVYRWKYVMMECGRQREAADTTTLRSTNNHLFQRVSNEKEANCEMLSRWKSWIWVVEINVEKCDDGKDISFTYPLEVSLLRYSTRTRRSGSESNRSLRSLPLPPPALEPPPLLLALSDITDDDAVWLMWYLHL